MKKDCDNSKILRNIYLIYMCVKLLNVDEAGGYTYCSSLVTVKLTVSSHEANFYFAKYYCM